MHWVRLMGALLMAVAAFPGTTVGQGSGTTLAGRVIDAATGAPIVGALVQISGQNRRAETDSAGTYRLDDLVPGLLAVRVIRIGYAPVERNQLASGSRVTRADFHLTAAAVELPGVQVEGRPDAVEGPAILAGFEERRRMGGGVFLDLEVLERAGSRRISEVLRSAGNLRFIEDGPQVFIASSRQLARSIGRPPGPCYLEILVDGIVQAQGGEVRANVNQIVATHELAAVEIYPSTAAVPLKYRSISNMCGAILFWTKRGP